MKRPSSLAAIVPVALLLSACATRAALNVEVNGRKLEFEEFRDGKIPRGVEVLHIDPTSLRVQGDSPIQINGLPIVAQGDEFTVGGWSFRADRAAVVVVKPDGQIEVHVASKGTTPAQPPVVGPPAP